MLTLKQLNEEINKDNLTLKQLKFLYYERGLIAPVFSGKIAEFTHNDFAGCAKEFMEGVRSCSVQNV